MHVNPRKLLRFIAVSVAVVAVLLGLVIGAFQLAITYVPEYREQLQSWLNERTGLVVEFRDISARLRFYGPELVFDDAIVRTPDRTRILATAKRGSVGFDVWNSIGTGRLRGARFTLESPEIGLIRTREGRIQLMGQSAIPEHAGARPYAIEELPTGRFGVRAAVVSFRDEMTGRGPWSLSGVNFELTRGTRELHLHGDASLPAALGESLKFAASATGPLGEPQTLVSTFEVEGSQVDLAGWSDVFPDQWPAPETGRGSLSVSGEFRGLKLQRLSADLDFVGVAAAAPEWTIPLPVAQPMQQPPDTESGSGPAAPDTTGEAEQAAETAPTPVSAAVSATAELISYERIALKFAAQRTDSGSADEQSWRAAVTDLQLTRRDAPWRARSLEADWTRTATGGVTIRGKADRLQLENLAPLLAYLPESAALAHLRALSPAGAIDDLTLAMARAGSQAPWTYSLQARLADVGFRPVGKVPGFAGISGAVSADDRGGEFKVKATDLQFELPRLFRTPLGARSIEGAISWTREATGWRIGSDALRVDSDDGRAQAKFVATVPDDGSSPLIDMSAQGQNLNVASTSRYMPAGRLSPKALAWLDRAFVSGRVAQAQMRYAGPSRSFPFRNGDGEFTIRASVVDTVFDYQAGWAPATALTADVEFRNQGMLVHSASGDVGGLRLVAATASFPDFKQGDLTIEASSAGDVQQALRFLQSSPIGPKLGEQFQRLSGVGALQAGVKLFLPIRHLADRRLEVRSRITNATLALEKPDAPLTALNGSLSVRDTLIESANLRGVWLGGPVRIAIEPQTRGRRVASSMLTASGRATAAQLAPVLHLPANVKLSGATGWQLQTLLTSNANGPSGDDAVSGRTPPREVRIDSDLRGLGISLPEPLGKQAQDVRALHLDLEFGGTPGVQSLLARASLGDVRGLFRMRQGADGWSFDRGGVRADGVTAAFPDHPGLRIEGRVERFVLDDWLALRSEQPGARRLSDLLRAANVRVGSFELFGYRFSDVRGILQATDAAWRVDVDGPAAVGQLTIPYEFSSSQPLVATLERLLVAQRERGSGGSLRDPRSLPALQAHIGDLRVGERTIGAVDLQVSRVPQGVRVDRLTVRTPSLDAEVSAQWFVTGGLARVGGVSADAAPQRSALTARVTSTDVNASLRALGYPQFMEAKRGEIRADLAWSGGFSTDFLGIASGSLAVDAESGQLLNLEPGAGRVLGLFSLAALPRRLALDFSDLTDKGLSFDSVHGDFELRDGNAYTTNLLLRGPAAEIGIAGRTGLGTRDYDQTAIVTGNLGVSLPVAGALAGGPAVGAALLLFSQVFKEPLKGITRGYYRITGAWDDPNVERVEAQDVKEASTGAMLR